MKGLDPRLRGRIVCPVCQRVFDEQVACLACVDCGLEFPIVDGVPVLLPQRAKKLRKAKGPEVG